ncbi:type 1 fimbrial protein [Achromobacter pestifer]|uniref:Type 1 fimbrial protein n=1 Tax=Achromobacter pestifer TaxID=1353889 RepID=A0A7D4E693_9BURK|nr:fimbrial protein [Achromobacter pestifer]QKH36231.1 type 1 fimbrial protein [Achromobacter pestifer]
MTQHPTPARARRGKPARPAYALLAAAVTLQCAPAHGELIMTRPAINCTQSNQAGGPWREVAPLTSSSRIGDVLFERGAGLFNNFQFGSGVSPGVLHEMVAAAQWGPNVGVAADGTARTNVPGIGLQVSVMGADGVERRIKPGALPVVMDKRPVYYDTSGSWSQKSSTVTEYIQRLVLLDSPANLPSGELKVTGVDPNIILTLYAINYQQGRVGYGDSIQSFPVWTPGIPGACGNQPFSYQGTGVIGIGGGTGVIVPNKCEVGTYRTIPVSLGDWPVSTFDAPGAASPSKDFSITLSQCSAAAKPTITFADKYGQNADPHVLSLKPGSETAQGIGIAMFNDTANTPVRYGAAYDMQRVGDQAVLALRAHYVRTAPADGAVKAGTADGSAEFTFEFP